jgi:flavin-dependent dehydrogenase
MDADVLIIGCGPGGASAACYLRQAGHTVIVLEKEKFPRFHIGESLLPYNQGLFKELGLTPAIKAANFPIKYGAQFHLMDGSKSTRFVFRNGRFTAHTEAIQVERAKFDHIMMKRAAEVGADVREGWTVRRFTENKNGVELEAADPSGATHTLRARYLIDASGRNNVTGNQEQLREIHENHRKFAIFGHFGGIKLDEGEMAGDTIIVRLHNRWFWIIPISSARTSVGLVIDRADLEKEGNDSEASFWNAVNSSPVVRERLKGAELDGEIRTIADFSYHNRKLIGARLLRVGDAAGFMDPIFSAGVYLAMWSGKLAAHTVSKAMANGEPANALHGYDRRVMKAMRVYWRLVENFYTTPFVELFMQPKPPMDLPAAVVAVLAGELEGGWQIRWRLEVFYFLVWLQKRWPVVPRLSLSEMSEPAHAAAQ